MSALVEDGAGDGAGGGTEIHFCARCGANGAGLVCSGCRRYCTIACQKKAWKQGHKTACLKLCEDDQPAKLPTEQAPAELDKEGGAHAELDKEGIEPDELNDQPLYEGSHMECLQIQAAVKRDARRFRGDAVALAMSLLRKGKDAEHNDGYDQALGSLLRALEMGLDLEEDLLVAACHESIGSVFLKQGRPDMAQVALKEAIRLHRSFEHDEECVVRCLSNAMVMYNDQGQFEEALEVSEELLRIQKKRLGDEHPGVVGLINDVGTFYFGLGKLSEALETFEEALRIIGKAGDEALPIFGQVFLNVAPLYKEQGKNSEALASLKEAIRYMKKARGEKNGKARPEEENQSHLIGAAYHQMGLAVFEQGEHDKALKLFEKAIKILGKALGEQSKEVANVQYNMAQIHRLQGHVQKARELFGTSASTLSRVLGAQHSMTREAFGSALQCSRSRS